MQYKTDQEWSKIRFQNSLGPQIGGLLHDSCAIVIGIGIKNRSVESVESDIKGWLDILYDIAENKKAQLTEVKPLDIDRAQKMGDKWKASLEEANKKIDQEVMEGREREAQDKINYQP